MPVQIDYKVIGLHISFYRKQMRLTQEQLAELAGISQQFLGNLERGRAIPSVKTLLALCDALHVTSHDLLQNSAEHDPDAPCTLRDDNSALKPLLSANPLLHGKKQVTYISLDDLPALDIELPAIPPCD